MNEEKIRKLFAAAQRENVPVPSGDFTAGVLRVIRHDSVTGEPRTVSLFDQLNRLFPRLALASVLVMMAGVAVDYALTAASPSDLSDDVARISAQWLLTPAGF